MGASPWRWWWSKRGGGEAAGVHVRASRAGAGLVALTCIGSRSRHLPGSHAVYQVVFAWYVSLWSGCRVLPFRRGNAFDAAVDAWDPSEEFVEGLRRYDEVRREGASRRGSLLAVYVVLKPHDGRKIADVVRRVRAAVGSDRRGEVWFAHLPLPPECELGEFDV